MRILHMYYDLLNNHGDQGNLLIIEDYLKENNIKYNIDRLSIKDKINIKKYDFIYIGGGSKVSLKQALTDITKYNNDFDKYINDNKYLFVSGESVNLFNKTLYINNEKYDGLNLVDVTSKEYDDYMRGDIFTSYKNMDDIILFKLTDTYYDSNNEELLFNDIDSFKKNNFYGIKAIGPILIRNPHFTNYLLRKITLHNNLKYKDVNLNKYREAYEEYINNFKK